MLTGTYGLAIGGLPSSMRDRRVAHTAAGRIPPSRRTRKRPLPIARRLLLVRHRGRHGDRPGDGRPHRLADTPCAALRGAGDERHCESDRRGRSLASSADAPQPRTRWPHWRERSTTCSSSSRARTCSSPRKLPLDGKPSRRCCGRIRTSRDWSRNEPGAGAGERSSTQRGALCARRRRRGRRSFGLDRRDRRVLRFAAPPRDVRDFAADTNVQGPRRISCADSRFTPDAIADAFVMARDQRPGFSAQSRCRSDRNGSCAFGALRAGIASGMTPVARLRARGARLRAARSCAGRPRLHRHSPRREREQKVERCTCA